MRTRISKVQSRRRAMAQLTRSKEENGLSNLLGDTKPLQRVQLPDLAKPSPLLCSLEAGRGRRKSATALRLADGTYV